LITLLLLRQKLTPPLIRQLINRSWNLNFLQSLQGIEHYATLSFHITRLTEHAASPEFHP
jgi:hypothetical protein